MCCLTSCAVFLVVSGTCGDPTPAAPATASKADAKPDAKAAAKPAAANAAAKPADAGVSANPTDPFVLAMGQNVYRTKNYFIAAYHYVQCYGNDLVVPVSTAEVAQAMAHYHKQAQVLVVVLGWQQASRYGSATAGGSRSSRYT